MREIEGFRRGGRGAPYAGKPTPSWDAGMAPQGKDEPARERPRHTSWSDPLGLSQVEAFGNSLEDSVSFRFPFWLSLGGAPLLR
jgi:hypothetical protein